MSPPFSDNFWGEGDRGFEVLYDRMRVGKHVAEDILEIIAQRAAIEEDYSKKLAKLAKIAVGKVWFPPLLYGPFSGLLTLAPPRRTSSGR